MVLSTFDANMKMALTFFVLLSMVSVVYPLHCTTCQKFYNDNWSNLLLHQTACHTEECVAGTDRCMYMKVNFVYQGGNSRGWVKQCAHSQTCTDSRATCNSVQSYLRGLGFSFLDVKTCEPQCSTSNEFADSSSLFIRPSWILVAILVVAVFCTLM